MADTNQTLVAPVTSGAGTSAQKTATPSGKVHIFSVRKYNRQRDGRPMVAFNVTDTSRGFHLSAQQLIAAGVIEPGLLQDTHMIVEFYKKGEIMPRSNREVTEDGMIVKSFIINEDKEVLREVTVALKLKQAENWMDAALKSSIQGRANVPNQFTIGDQIPPIGTGNQNAPNDFGEGEHTDEP